MSSLYLEQVLRQQVGTVGSASRGCGSGVVGGIAVEQQKRDTSLSLCPLIPNQECIDNLFGFQSRENNKFTTYMNTIYTKVSLISKEFSSYIFQLVPLKYQDVPSLLKP